MLRERLGIKVLSVTQPMGEDPSDHSAFLAESIHEMFDEYYSVSLSFCTRTARRRGRDTSSARCLGVTEGILRPHLRCPILSGRHSCVSCSSATPTARNPTDRLQPGSIVSVVTFR